MARKKPAKRTIRKKTNKKKQQESSFGRLMLKWLFVSFLWAVIIGGLVAAWYARDLPEMAAKAGFEKRPSIVVKDARGEIIMRYGEVKGASLTLADMPDHMIWAVLATEDRRFYSHPGIDIWGLMRAMMTNMREGRIVQGGSTITQQLAKNLFLSHERTYKRKIQEAMLALWLEYELSKDEILSAYLNRVYLGAGTYGIDAASALYFNKPAADISLREAAILAGMLKAPSRFSPTKNPGLANKRADVVLGAMADAGYITAGSAKELSNPAPRPPRKPQGGNAVRYFTDWAIDGLDELIGVPDTDLIIETTLNSHIQEKAAAALSRTLQRYGKERDIGQGAMIVMGLDGRILAMIGGEDYNQSQFNRAVQAKRQPGSAFKPVVFLTALEQGWEPEDLILDAPIEKGTFQDYQPENFKNEYHGEVTLEQALTMSMNTAAVRLMDEVGRKEVINTARKMGIISPLEQDLSLALGSSAVSLLEMNLAYGTLATGGLAVYPYAITRITDKDGRIYYERDVRTFARRVIDTKHVRQMNQMLRSVVEYGTGRGAALNIPVAGKTGTSQNSRDAWFMGYTDRLVAGVWLGNDDNTPMKGVTGGSFPARIWGEVIAETYAHAPQNNTDLLSESRPAGLFDALLGRLNSEDEMRWQQYGSTLNDNGSEERHERQRRYND